MTRRLLYLLPATLLATAAIAQQGSMWSRTTSSSTPQITPAQAELARLATQIQSLQIAIETLQAQQEVISRDQAALNTRITRLEQNAGKADSQEIIALKRDIDSVRQAQATMRTEIVNEITSKISTMLAARQKNTATNKTSEQKQIKQTGHSHTVETGQTLSKIAQAYETTVDKIMKANDLKDASKLRVGQVLFIPD